eukprot:COSAG05_NODE_11210_length_525_cov_0.680751_1_plen_49_part_01
MHIYDPQIRKLYACQRSTKDPKPRLGPANDHLSQPISLLRVRVQLIGQL